VLPDNNGILIEIRNIGTANSPGVLLHHHPSYAINMLAAERWQSEETHVLAIKKSLADRVRVLVGIGVTMVRSVTTASR